MKVAGTSDTGWIPVDLRDVAAAIATLRGSAVVARERAKQAREQQERSALRR